MPVIEISAPPPQHVEVFIDPSELNKLVAGSIEDGRKVVMVRHVDADGKTLHKYRGYEARFELCHLMLSPERQHSPHAYIKAHWVALEVP